MGQIQGKQPEDVAYVQNNRLLVTDAEGLPTGGNNPSYSLGYTGDNVTQIDQEIDGVTYRLTLTYTGDNVTAISSWSEV